MTNANGNARKFLSGLPFIHVPQTRLSSSLASAAAGGGGEREGKRARPKRLLSPPNATQETAALPQTLVAFHSKVQTSRGKPFCLFPHSIPLLLSLNPIGYEPALLPKPSLLPSINPKRQTDPPDRCIQYHIGTRAT